MKLKFNSTELDKLFGFDNPPIIFEEELDFEGVSPMMTEEMKKQISLTMTGRKRGKYKPRTKPCSEETKRRRSEAAKRNNAAAHLQNKETWAKMAATKRKQFKPRDALGRFINSGEGVLDL
jgi:hypothetical protein